MTDMDFDDLFGSLLPDVPVAGLDAVTYQALHPAASSQGRTIDQSRGVKALASASGGGDAEFVARQTPADQICSFEPATLQVPDWPRAPTPLRLVGLRLVKSLKNFTQIGARGTVLSGSRADGLVHLRDCRWSLSADGMFAALTRPSNYS